VDGLNGFNSLTTMSRADYDTLLDTLLQSTMEQCSLLPQWGTPQVADKLQQSAADPLPLASSCNALYEALQSLHEHERLDVLLQSVERLCTTCRVLNGQVVKLAGEMQSLQQQLTGLLSSSL
jgi:hypothetical protein